MSIKLSNLVSLLEEAAAGQILYVVNAYQDYDGMRFNQASTRIWEDDVVTNISVARVARTEAEMPHGVYVKSLMSLMDIADNAVPFTKHGARGWELDNTEGRLHISPERALRALSEVRSNGMLLH